MEPLSIQGAVSHGVGAAPRPAAKPVAPDDSAAIPEPRDTLTRAVDLGREGRISLALSKAALHVGDWIKAGTAALVGETVGLAVGAVILGTSVSTPIFAVVGGAGALAGLLADHYHVPSKVSSAVHGAVASAASHVREAGNHVLGGVRTALGFDAETGAAEEPKVGGEAVKAERAPRSKVLSTLVSGLTGAAKALKSLPSFLYPSIKHATAAEKKLIIDTLDGLPLKDVTSVGSIAMSDTLGEKLGAAGLARNELFRKSIMFDRGELAVEGWGKDVIIHEVGHTRDMADGLLPLTGDSGIGPFKGIGPWGKPPHITDYAATNNMEDFAESHVAFHESPDKLKALSPEKFDAMQKVHEPGLYDKVMDRTGVREAGKKIAEAIDAVPYLRETLQLAGAVMGPIQLHHGAEELQQGIMADDAAQRYAGKMDLAQGVAFSTKAAAPVGLGLLGLRLYLNRRLKKGKMTLEQAENVANKSLAAMAGPVGLTVYSAVKEMLRRDEGAAVDSSPARVTMAKKGEEKLFDGNEMFLRHREVLVDGAPATGTDLTKDDKVFMAKVGGGAVIGGIAGTLAGWEGGALAGAVIGGLAGGPFGAALGAFIGKAAGILTLSYAGSRLGARLGRMLDRQS